MTAMPSAKLASRPSVRLLAPNPAPSSTKTKHATGMENFLCASMIGAWGDTPAARIAAACSFSSGMVNSRSPRSGPPAGNSDSASNWIRSSRNECTS